MNYAHIDIVGYIAAGFVFCSFYMRTMKALRTVAIMSNLFSLVYAYLNGATPLMFLHMALLPLNIIRLQQLYGLLSRMQKETSSHYNFAALMPYMTVENYTSGQVVFEIGDKADKFYIIKSGTISCPQLTVELSEGEILGEIGIFSTQQKRTASAIATQDATLLSITEDTIIQLHHQDPEFSFYLIRLVITRLGRGAEISNS
jgi:CRP/FNR family transcriptional regulator, cyclic AMP receptor protein